MERWALLLVPILLSCIRERRAPTTTTDGAETGPSGPRGGVTIDPMQREVVRAFFAQHYAPFDSVPSEWNGNVDLRLPGTTSAAFKAAIIERVNYFRAMAGVPADVTLAELESQKDQSAAMMMSAQNALSHNPDSSWAGYTPEGAEAAGKSNLYLGVRGPAAITGYIRDPGANNAAVGHRRWVLYPQTRTMGTGDVEAAGKHAAANALWVAESATSNSPRPPVRDAYVAWPPRGYVPYQVVFQRWSLSYPEASFESATVEIVRDGQPIALHNPPYVSNGYGENTIIWELPGLIDADGVMIQPTADTSIAVVVRNVQIAGSMRDLRYTVIAFDPGTVVAPPPIAPPPAEWPANIPTPWGTIPTLKPTTAPTMPTGMPTTLPTTFPSTIPTTFPLPGMK